MQTGKRQGARHYERIVNRLIHQLVLKTGSEYNEEDRRLVVQTASMERVRRFAAG